MLCLSVYMEGMVKKIGLRLRDTAYWLPLAAGASSRNLGPIFVTISENPSVPISEVRRLKMETCGILHTENLYKTLAKLLRPIW